MDIFTPQTSFINAFGDYPTDKVFACSSPPVQGKGKRLFGLGVVQEALHGLYNHLVHQVLPEQLLVQILLQSWTERPHRQQRGEGSRRLLPPSRRVQQHPPRREGRQPHASKGPAELEQRPAAHASPTGTPPHRPCPAPGASAPPPTPSSHLPPCPLGPPRPRTGGGALVVPLEAALPEVAVEPRVGDKAGKGRGGGAGDR